jgi:hypothetical protein
LLKDEYLPKKYSLVSPGPPTDGSLELKKPDLKLRGWYVA